MTVEVVDDSGKLSSYDFVNKDLDFDPHQDEATRDSLKLDKIYDVLNHIRWIGLSIAMMFALTFVIPNL